MEPNSDNHKMDIKVEMKEEPNGTLTQVKCEYEDDIHSETVFVSTPFVKESEMCNKTEIKEEPHWSETTSSEIKQEIELPCTADVDLSNEIKETGEDAEQLYRLYVCRNSSNLGENSEGISDTEEASQNLNSKHLQILEEPKTNYNILSLDMKDRTVHSCRITQASVDEGKRPYGCGTCSKSFRDRQTLKRHNLIHEGKRPYTCEVCNRSFTHVSDMKKHKLTTHEGKRPYECENCGKGFRDRHTLKRHELIHEGKRPYTCEICNKSFNQISNMKTHKLIHEGRKPYTCEICSKSFTELSTLKRHKLTHKDKRLYTCEICNLKCIHESYLEKHKSTHRAY